MRWRMKGIFILTFIPLLISTDRARPIKPDAIRGLLLNKPKVYASFLFSEKAQAYKVTVGMAAGWLEGKLILLTGSTKDYMTGNEKAYERLEHYACNFTGHPQISGQELGIAIFAPLVKSGVAEVIPKGRKALFIGPGGWPQAVEGLGWSLMLEVHGKIGGKTIITIPFEKELNHFPPESREMKPWMKELQPVFWIVKEKLLHIVYQSKYRIYPTPIEPYRANLPCEELSTPTIPGSSVALGENKQKK